MKKSASVLFAAFLAAAFLFGCSGPARSSGTAAPRNAASAAAGAAEDRSPYGGLSANGSASSSAAESTAVSAGRKIEKSARITLETLDYEKATARFESLVGSCGGYIESSSVQGTGVNGSGRLRCATYTARIPAQKLDAFLNDSSGIGNMTERGISGQDVTQDYVDTDARLKSLKTERDRLLALMAKAAKVEDLLNIENRLTQVQSEIDRQAAELKNMDSLVSYSTVTASIQEVTAVTRPAEKSLWGQMGATLSSSVAALGRTVRWLLIAVTAVLPFAAAAAAVFMIAFFARRSLKKKKAGRKPGGPKPGGPS